MDIVECLEIMASLEKCFIHISDLIRETNSVKLGTLANIHNTSGDDVKTIDVMSNDIM